MPLLVFVSWVNGGMQNGAMNPQNVHTWNHTHEVHAYTLTYTQFTYTLKYMFTHSHSLVCTHSYIYTLPCMHTHFLIISHTLHWPSSKAKECKWCSFLELSGEQSSGQLTHVVCWISKGKVLWSPRWQNSHQIWTLIWHVVTSHSQGSQRINWKARVLMLARILERNITNRVPIVQTQYMLWRELAGLAYTIGRR